MVPIRRPARWFHVRLPTRAPEPIFPPMSTLAEIEAAADSLSSEDKEALLRFLAMRLRKERALPPPRIYADGEMAAMLAEDEADGARLRAETPNLPR